MDSVVDCHDIVANIVIDAVMESVKVSLLSITFTVLAISIAGEERCG